YRQGCKRLQVRGIAEATMIASALKVFPSKNSRRTMRCFCSCTLLIGLGGFFALDATAQTAAVDKPLLIQRPARTWEFLCSVGKRAGIFGNESGRVEAWAYPLKVMRDLRVTIHHDGKSLPAESLVRTIEARPESTTLVYAGDTFTIREKFFVPVD